MTVTSRRNSTLQSPYYGSPTFSHNIFSSLILDEVEKQKPVPKASDIKDIVANEYENGFVSIISVDLDEYSKKHSNKAVKKTLTIPAWLNTIAEKEKINYSQLLQDALKNHLGIKQP